MTNSKRVWCLGVLLLTTVATASENAKSAAAPAIGKACSAPGFREFDFWLGEWRVIGGPKRDTWVGTSRITRVASGCGLAEHWINSTGTDGRSLNTYDAGAKQWSQFWVGSDGVILHLRGGLREGVMVLQGELPKAAGGTQLQRIRWTPQPDGNVVQKWETSDDAGKSWQISFVGLYQRQTSKAP